MRTCHDSNISQLLGVNTCFKYKLVVNTELVGGPTDKYSFVWRLKIAFTSFYDVEGDLYWLLSTRAHKGNEPKKRVKISANNNVLLGSLQAAAWSRIPLQYWLGNTFKTYLSSQSTHPYGAILFLLLMTGLTFLKSECFKSDS